MSKVELRIGANRLGSGTSTSRVVWNVGIDRALLDEIPRDDRRVRLEHENGSLKLILGDGGIMPSGGRGSRFGYASQLSTHWLTNLRTPDESHSVATLFGDYDPQSGSITVQGDLPQWVQETFLDPIEDPNEADHFPGQRFGSVIDEALHKVVEEIKTKPSASPLNFALNSDAEDGAQDELDLSPAAIEARDWLDEQVQLGSKNIHSAVVTLTTDLACELLRRNKINRRLRSAKLVQYVDDVKNDRWDLNGEAIIMDDEGDLLNGQHRCHAVIQAGKSIQTLMIFGVSKEARRTIDNGAGRTPGDHLGIEGFTQPTTLAAAARILLAYELSEGKNLSHMNRISSVKVFDEAMSNAELEKSSHFPYRSSRHKLLAAPSVMAFAHYIFSKINADDAEAYLDQVVNGVNLTEDSPAYYVREKLGRMTRVVKDQRVEVLFKGWNAFRKGRTMRSVQIQGELPKLV